MGFSVLKLGQSGQTRVSWLLFFPNWFWGYKQWCVWSTVVILWPSFCFISRDPKLEEVLCLNPAWRWILFVIHVYQLRDFTQTNPVSWLLLKESEGQEVFWPEFLSGSNQWNPLDQHELGFVIASTKSVSPICFACPNSVGISVEIMHVICTVLGT